MVTGHAYMRVELFLGLHLLQWWLYYFNWVQNNMALYTLCFTTTPTHIFVLICPAEVVLRGIVKTYQFSRGSGTMQSATKEKYFIHKSADISSWDITQHFWDIIWHAIAPSTLIVINLLYPDCTLDHYRLMMKGELSCRILPLSQIIKVLWYY